MKKVIKENLKGLIKDVGSRFFQIGSYEKEVNFEKELKYFQKNIF